MFKTEELGHIMDGITVGLLQSWCWKGHSYDIVCDIGKIKVKLLIHHSILRASNYLSD